MNSPCISVVVEGAVISAARLIVVLFMVVWAHVKGGEQTACRHNLILAHLWCVYKQPSLHREGGRYQTRAEHRYSTVF